MKYRLKQEYIEAIKRDPDLWAKVAKTLGIGSASLAYPLRNNSIKFTQKNILKVLSDYLGVPENDLVKEIEESETV